MKLRLRKTNFLKNQKGQGVVEYLLLLFVVVALIFGVVLGLADSTRRFADNYFGAYFQCLLEAGELPTLGYEGPSQVSECNGEFQPFTLSEGRPPLASSSTSSSSSQSSANSSSSSLSSESDSSSGGSEYSAGSYVPASTSSSDFSTSTSGQTRRVPINRNNQNANTEQNPTLSSSLSSDESSSPENLRADYIPIVSSRTSFGEEDEDNNIQAVNAPIDDTEELRDTKIIPVVERTLSQSDENIDTSLTLPDFIRYLLIIGIILAIVVFLGGQVLQYQKSKE